MRCTNCGWNNPEGLENCQKCNEPLPVSVKKVEIESEVKEAIKEACPKCGYPVSSTDDYCPNCGASTKQQEKPLETYANKETLRRAADFVPDVPEEVSVPKKNDIAPTIKQTVRDWEHSSSSERSIGTESIKKTIREVFSSPKNEKKENSFELIPADAFCGNEIKSFSGDSVIVNRANLDNQNTFIEENKHTLFVNEGGKWFIKDESGKDATYIVVKRKTALEDGDIVIIGNRKYVFK